MKRITKPADNRFQEAEESYWYAVGFFTCERCDTELDMMRSKIGHVAFEMVCSECGHGHFFHENTFDPEEETLEDTYRVGARGIYGGGD